VTQSQKLAPEVKFVHYINNFGRLSIIITGKQSPLEGNKLQVRKKMHFHPRKIFRSQTWVRSKGQTISTIGMKGLHIFHMKNDGKVTANVLAYVPETHPIFFFWKKTHFIRAEKQETQTQCHKRKRKYKSLY